ncbi:MAG TPA: amidohydrolase family protein [Gemmatimonadaceae bacterium]|nr:amidohydrolase family protein [Gemmatimonadaceae bacterium]
MIRYRARWVMPITAPPIGNGVVAVANGRIAYVGPADHGPAGDDVELGDALLLPGLVNAHCHLELTAMRGFLEDVDFRRWILRLTNARRAVLDRGALLDSARFGLEEGIRAGITSYADTCASGVVMQAMRELGVRGIMYQEVFGPDPAQCGESIAGLRAQIAGLRYLETPLVRLGVSPHAPYTVSDELFRAAARLAEDDRLPLAVHVAESELEQQLVVRGAGSFADGLRRRGIAVSVRAVSPVRLLEALGVLERKPLLIHCVRVDADDVRAIAASGSCVAHCPASNAKLGHGVAPLDELLAAGIPVGLGSDSMASNNRMDMLDEARLALLAQRIRTASNETPSAADVLELATLGGARAIGLASLVGSLEEGKQADLAAFALDPAGPTHDPVTAAVFSVTGARARFVAVAGTILLRDGRLVAPRPGLAERMQVLAEALDAWLAAGGEMMGVV